MIAVLTWVLPVALAGGLQVEEVAPPADPLPTLSSAEPLPTLSPAEPLPTLSPAVELAPAAPQLPAPFPLEPARAAHARARAGLIVQATGGAVGILTLLGGEVLYFGCALDNACITPEARATMGVGAGVAIVSLGVGGGLMAEGHLRTAHMLNAHDGDGRMGLAVAGLALDGAAVGMLAGAVAFGQGGTGLWDAAAATGLTLGGAVLWISSTALSGRQLRRSARELDGFESPSVRLRVAPMLDPGTRTVGVYGIW